MSEILARILRNDRVESLHRGHIAVVNADGNLIASVGNPQFPTYIRSAAKPFQVMPLLESGAVQKFGFNDQELAVMIASHNGEAIHVQTVAGILQKLDLDETYLKCGIHPPLHKPTAEALLKQNQKPGILHNNCSGKHSGMLALALFHDWNLEKYFKPEHPVQLVIKERVALFSGLTADEIAVGIDGCSVPVFYLPLQNMARMYARLAEGKIGVSRRVLELMTANLEMIAGSQRFDTDFMRVMAGRMVSKVGAEGIRCVGVAGERPLGITLKIEDGDKRASEAVILEVLAQLELISDKELEQLPAYRNPILTNHSGIKTGQIVADFNLEK